MWSSSERDEVLRATGLVRWELTSGDDIRASGSAVNIITAYGQRMYWERGASVPNYPSAPTGMRLGTGDATPTWSGAGSAIETYLSGSALALSAAPVSTSPASNRRVTYLCNWLAGVATGSISEAVLTNENPLSDIPGIDANTVARVVFDPPIDKGTLDGLSITWHHTLGA